MDVVSPPRNRLILNVLAPVLRSSTGIMAERRLKHILQELTPLPESVGTLKLGNITYEVPAALTPSRLSRSKDLLNINDQVNRDNLYFLLQKHLLGQDVFLVSQPGPYARRLALTFARHARIFALTNRMLNECAA